MVHGLLALNLAGARGRKALNLAGCAWELCQPARFGFGPEFGWGVWERRAQAGGVWVEMVCLT